MTQDTVEYTITVEGDQYAISKWEEQIQDIAGEELDVEVERADIKE